MVAKILILVDIGMITCNLLRYSIFSNGVCFVHDAHCQSLSCLPFVLMCSLSVCELFTILYTQHNIFTGIMSRIMISDDSILACLDEIIANDESEDEFMNDLFGNYY